MTGAALVAFLLAGALAGGIIGWASHDLVELVREWRASRARRRLVAQSFEPDWTPADDEWLDTWGIRP